MNKTRPVRPKQGDAVKADHMANHAQAIEELQNKVFASEKNDKFAKRIKPQFWVNIYKEGSDWKAFMQTGEVIARDNTTGFVVKNFTPTDIPTRDAPLTITASTKIWCLVEEDDTGIAFGAEIGSGTSWPTSTAPELIGGDNTTGANGERYYKIAQFTEVGYGLLAKEQLYAGPIDHFQPVLCENTTDSPLDNRGRILKAWNPAEGRWEFRYLEAGTGISVVESEDKILISNSSANPWIVSDGGSGNAAVAPGFIMGYFLTAGSTNFPPTETTLGPCGQYAGGTIAISGTQYIYAELAKNVSAASYMTAQTDLELSEGTFILSAEIIDDIRPVFDDVKTVALVTSEDGPGAYVPTSGDVAVCIAKVTNSGGTITVDAQYITHNPTLFLPYLSLPTPTPE